MTANCEALPHFRQLVERTGLVCERETESGGQWQLDVSDGALALVELADRRLRPLSVDFVKARRQHRSLPIARRGPMVRALGRSTRQVVDATAGWGGDLYLMWLMGYAVEAVERSPVMAALLLDGLARLEAYDPEAESPRLQVGDAAELLAGREVECVYLDPMFPPRRKASALAGRPLRVLRTLVGDDEDRPRLFEAAWRAAVKRVVVKRPNYARPLREPDESFSGKLMSYDVYLK